MHADGRPTASRCRPHCAVGVNAPPQPDWHTATRLLCACVVTARPRCRWQRHQLLTMLFLCKTIGRTVLLRFGCIGVHGCRDVPLDGVAHFANFSHTRASAHRAGTHDVPRSPRAKVV